MSAPGAIERFVPPPGKITKAERASLMRLRQEVTAEEARLMSEVSTRVAQQARDNNAQADEFHAACRRITDEANAKITALINDNNELFGAGGKWRRPHSFQAPRAYREQVDEESLRRAMVAEIRNRAQAAKLKIARDETDRLMDIQVDALQTDVSRNLVRSLPSMADLMTVDLKVLEEAA